MELLHIIFLFSSHVPVVAATKLLKGSIGRKAFLKWYGHLRDVCSQPCVGEERGTWIRKALAMLGDPGGEGSRESSNGGFPIAQLFT